MKPISRRNIVAFVCGLGCIPVFVVADRAAPNLIGTHRPLLPLLALAVSGLVVALVVRQPRPYFSLGVLLACIAAAFDVDPADSVGLEVTAGLMAACIAFAGELAGTIAYHCLRRPSCS